MSSDDERYEKYLTHQKDFSDKYQRKEKRLLLYLKRKSCEFTQTHKGSCEDSGTKHNYVIFESVDTAILLKTNSCAVSESLKKKFEQKLEEIDKNKKCFINLCQKYPEMFENKTITFEQFLDNVSIFIEVYKDTLPKIVNQLFFCWQCYFVFAKCKTQCDCRCPCWNQENPNIEEFFRDYATEE